MIEYMKEASEEAMNYGNIWIELHPLGFVVKGRSNNEAARRMIMYEDLQQCKVNLLLLEIEYVVKLLKIKKLEFQ
jgi:hypothetical protein